MFVPDPALADLSALFNQSVSHSRHFEQNISMYKHCKHFTFHCFALFEQFDVLFHVLCSSVDFIEFVQKFVAQVLH